LGPVDNPAEFYSLVDVVLAPLSLGGGMKVKIVEALLAGVPVVASAAAAEGIPNEVADLLIPWTELQRLDSLLPVYADRILQVSARTALDPFTQNGFRQRVERFLLWEQ
jgi:glycosyltransferase involved in cell wall biosynthesis